jgi:hypothetical protein
LPEQIVATLSVLYLEKVRSPVNQTSSCRAFIHIGPHKTGTTAIQSAFGAARDTLRHVGYHYLEGLDGKPNHSEVLATAFWAPDKAYRLGHLRWIDDPAEFQHHRQLILDKLTEEIQIQCSAPHNLVISGEELSWFDEDEARRLVTFLQVYYNEIRVVAYVREPQSWMTSFAQQRTRWSGGILEEMFACPPLPAYRKRFEPYIRAVGKENFTMRPFFTKSRNFDVVADFAGVIGVDAALLPSRLQEKGNFASSDRSAIILSAVNKYAPPFFESRHNPCRAFRVVKDAKMPGGPFVLPRETILSVADLLEEERHWINGYLGYQACNRPNLPTVSRENWFGPDWEALEEHAKLLNDTFRQAQNEIALRSLWKAHELRETNLNVARDCLSRALLLSTDRWTMHYIALESVTTRHPKQMVAFAKQRLMRRIEDPRPTDPPLLMGNPFDRI